MDTGTYRLDRATDPGNSQYVPLGLQEAVYYIPRQPAADWPHFFAVKVRYADLDSPPHVTGTGYLVFAQASPGAPWKDVIEPYLIPAVTPAPAIAVDAQGYAQPVSITGSASGLSAAPGQIQPDTIRWLDREAAAGADPADTGGLSDLRDVIFWRGELPSGTVTDTHTPARPGLRAADRRRRRPVLLLADRAAPAAPPARRHLPRHDPRVLLAQPGPPVGHGRVHRAVRSLRPGPRERRPAGRRSRLQHRRAGMKPRMTRACADCGFRQDACFPFPGPGPAERGNRRSCLRGGAS